jgi:hypothetical protein
VRQAVSFDLNEVRRLQYAGGAVWEKYRRLLSAADQALHDSLDHRALGEFEMAWKADPVAAAQQAEEEAGAADGYGD